MRLSGTEAWDRDATTRERGVAGRVLKRFLVAGLVFALVLTGRPPASTLASGEPPTANDETQSTREATPLALSLSASDLEDDPLTYAIVTPPANGSLDECSSGFCTYTPDTDPNFVGTDTFTWTANDGTSDSNEATFTIEVTANAAPVANDQVETVREGKPLALVLDASDGDFDELTYAIVDPPNEGTLDECSSGFCTYTPNTNFIGTDTFTWKANDGITDSNVATVTIEVTANAAPVASDQAETVREAKPLAFFLNASDDDFDSLTFTIVDPPSNGTLDSCPSGFCTYTADTVPNFVGTDTFTWTASDGISDSNEATVTIEVTANAAPTAIDGSATTHGPPIDVFLGAVDSDSDPLTYNIVTSPSNGSLSGPSCEGPNGSQCVYTPNPGFLGSDSFTFSVTDDLGDLRPGDIHDRRVSEHGPRRGRPVALRLHGHADASHAECHRC